MAQKSQKIGLSFDHKINEWKWESEEFRQNTIELWKKAFPKIDIEAQMAEMAVWLMSNPKKAQKSQWLRFVSGWLKRESIWSKRKNVESPYEKFVESGSFKNKTPPPDEEFNERW